VESLSFSWLSDFPFYSLQQKEAQDLTKSLLFRRQCYKHK
jgi:hypothetical protein